MKKSVISFILILNSLVVVACSNADTPNKDQAEIQQLQAEITRLKNENTKLEASLVEARRKIDENEKIYEIRNLVDLQAREIFRAMMKGEGGKLKPHISQKAAVEDKHFVYRVNSEIIRIPFIEDGRTFRQRSYHLDKDGRFITEYEVWRNDEIYSGLLELIFIEENNEWKLSSMQTDR